MTGHAPATLTVLGSCGGTPEAGRACAGMLLEAADTAVVLDLGFGTLSTLLDALDGDVTRVGGVIATHRHPDHVADLPGLLRVLRHSGGGHRPWLALPDGVREVLEVTDPDAWAHGPPVPLVPLPGDHPHLGAVSLAATLTPHWVPHAAVRVEVAGTSLAYSADGGVSADLDALARGVDVLDCGVTERNGSPSAEPDDSTFLMTGRQAGDVADRAGARTLVLTHFWPGSDRHRAEQDARDAFDGEVLAADEGTVLDLPPRP